MGYAKCPYMSLFMYVSLMTCSRIIICLDLTEAPLSPSTDFKNGKLSE